MAVRWKREKYLYLLVLPGLLYFIIYKYVPMLGLVVSFQEYSPFLGFAKSPWVGLEHFHRMLGDPEVLHVLGNTLYLSFLQIAFAFPVPLIVAIMLNEVRSEWYKRLIQSLVYLPHFLSWVVIVSIVTIFFKNDGIINLILDGVSGYKIDSILTDPGWLKPLIVLEVIWKESGWGTIIFLAALAGVNPQLYEAAIVDGANRWKLIWHITLPAIRNVIVILLILRLGTVLDSGFEQIFLHLNAFNKDSGNVLDTYVYYKGIKDAEYSFSTAVGLFKSVIGLFLIVLANRIAKRYGDEGLY